MPPCSHPPEPIPEPLRGLENPSFARETILHRLPKIVRVTLEENDFPPDTVENLRRLIAEIPDGPIREITIPLAPDADRWQDYIRPTLGQNWLEVPWFFAESYFYVRLLEATGYYQPGPGRGVDPFARQKQASLDAALQGPRHAVQDLIAAHQDLLELPPSRMQEAFVDLLFLDLIGNQVDLSRWPGAEGLAIQTNRDRILVDHSRQVAQTLFKAGAPHAGGQHNRVAFLIVNAGFELVADLCLADFLLHRHIVPQVVFHLKQQPVFVSDAMIKDVQAVLDTLARQAGRQTVPDLPAFARRIQDHLEHDRLRLRDDPFWTSPLAMWEAPPALLHDLSETRLVISKGDALYRRLVGDRHWEPTTPFSSIVCYLDAPLLALRTLKSEVVAGLRPGQAEKAQAEDPHWMTNGEWALMQWTGRENTV